jgi:hypothetical protein
MAVLKRIEEHRTLVKKVVECIEVDIIVLNMVLKLGYIKH